MKVAFHTLGCKVNQYETEAMREQFQKAGHTVVGETQAADAYIINTCTVTSLADRKSRQYIRRMKKLSPDSIVAVTGCYVQIKPDEVAAIEGVDIIAGTNEKENILSYIEEFSAGRMSRADAEGNTDLKMGSSDAEGNMNLKMGSSDKEGDVSGMAAEAATHSFRHVLPYEKLNEYTGSGIITSMESRTRAYIKIEDGCDRFCSYCVIPYARGPVRSRPQDEIIAEAESLVRRGFKELILTGINTALYEDLPGLLKRLDELEVFAEEEADNGERESKNSASESEIADTRSKYSDSVSEIVDVELKYSDSVSEIVDMESKNSDSVSATENHPLDFRVRLSSLEPTVVNAEYVKGLLGFRRLCHHLHLSIQSGSDNVLSAMRRRYEMKEYMEIVKVLREFDPLYGISTDMIAGFPGETDADIADSVDTISLVEFCKTHAFNYSQRPGTVAAGMSDQVPPPERKKRVGMLIQAGDLAAEKFAEKNVGTVGRVLFEERTVPEGSYKETIENESEIIEAVENQNERKESEIIEAVENQNERKESEIIEAVDNQNERKESGDDIFAYKNTRDLMAGYTGNYIRAYAELDEQLLGQLVDVKITGLYRDGVFVEPL